MADEKTPRVPERVPWIAEMMRDAGLYTHANEVDALGRRRDALAKVQS